MNHFNGGRVTVIATIITALMGTPVFAAEPILLKDIALGKSEVYGVSGNSETHLYVQPFPRNGVFAIDGTGQTATKVLEHEINYSMIGLGAIALFGYNDNRHGNELWRSDGTREGTYLVKDLIEGPASGLQLAFTRWGGAFTRWRDKVYFTTLPRKNQRNLPDPDDPANFDPPQLWSTDGTMEGTVSLTNLDTLTWFWDGDHAIWGWVNQFTSGQDKLFFTVSAFDFILEF